MKQSVYGKSVLRKDNIWMCWTLITAKKPNNLSNQLDIFIDQNGILICGGRLENANFSEAAKFPILLPPQEKLTSLIIDSAQCSQKVTTQ